MTSTSSSKNLLATLKSLKKSSSKGSITSSGKDETPDEDEFDDPRMQMRQLLGETSGRRVKSVMASPDNIKSLIKDHKNVLDLKEKQKLGELAVKREQRMLQLEKDRQKRKKGWEGRNGKGGKKKDEQDEEYLAIMQMEEAMRLAAKGRNLDDYDVVRRCRLTSA